MFPLISGHVWAAEEEFVWVNFMQIGLKTVYLPWNLAQKPNVVRMNACVYKYEYMVRANALAKLTLWPDNALAKL